MAAKGRWHLWQAEKTGGPAQAEPPGEKDDAVPTYASSSMRASSVSQTLST